MPLRKIKTEPEILKKFNLSKGQLDTLRLDKGFPYIELSKGVRVFNTDSILKWISQNEKNRAETNSNRPTSTPQ
jgi:hypothetical protein